MVPPIQKETKMVKRQIGEYARSASLTYTKDRDVVNRNLGVDVGYSKPDVQAVDIGDDNPTMSKKTPLDQLAPLYGGAGPQEDVAGNVSPRRDRGDRSYRNPRGR